MPVLRASQGIDLTGQDTRRYVQPELQAPAFRPNATVEVGDTQWKGRLVEALTGQLMPVAKQYTEVTQMDKYLQGQAKAGQISSEEEIQGNPLTRDWEVAGYRDTMGKLQIADSEAQLAVDMKTLREQSPEQMQQYLAERRNAITPNLGSMSREQRANAFGQLLLSDRAAITKHGAEHRAFIIDQKVRPIREQMMVGMSALEDVRTKASVDPSQYHGAYTQQLDAVAGNIMGNIWADTTLPKEVKQQFTVEALQHALNTGGVDVYEYFNNTQIDVGGGQTARVLSMLDDKDTVKLSNQFKAAMKESVLDRNMNEFNRKADFESQIEAGTYQGTQSDVQQDLNTWRSRKMIGPEAYEAYMQKFASMRAKQNDDGRLVDMFMNGDTQGMANQNKTPSQGLEATEKFFAKRQLPLAERATKLMDIGEQHGIGEAYKAVGKYLGPAIMQLGNPDGSINVDNAKLYNTVVNRIAVAESKGDRKAYTELLAGLSEPQQTKLIKVRAYQESGLPVDEAYRRATVDEAQLAAMPAYAKAAMSPSTQDITKALDEYDSQGTVMKKLRSMWDSTKGKLAPNEAAWFDDPRLVERQVAGTRKEILMEAGQLGLTNPGMQAKNLIDMAAAKVANRTVGTSQGPIILPRNVNPNAYFGVPPSVSSERIGAAIDTIMKPSQKGNRMEFEATPQGVRFREITPNGEATDRTGILDPKSVSTAVTEGMQAEAARANRVYGSGVNFVKNGITATFNGENTAALEESLMYAFRKNLVKNEGVRDKVYKDSKGIPTVGVGLTGRYMPKANPDGTYSKEALDTGFKRASNDAAAAGLRAANASGLQNEQAVLLFSELGYHSGTGFLEKFKSYRDTVAAMQTGDVQAAQEQFKKTPAYGVSGAERKRHYLELVAKATKGN